MNFFGHAVVASWQSSSPGFVLGAMVPDFATMIGARVPSATDDAVSAGIDFHHATDRVFHDAPTFRDLQSEARRTLRERGLPRPAALAVGHVGVELVLDFTLGESEAARAAYLAALRFAAASPFRHLAWGSALDHAQYAGLVGLLVARGAPEGASTGSIAVRIARTLSSRPRFRLDAAGERIVEEWVSLARPVVAARTSALRNEIVSGLVTSGRALPRLPRDP